MKRLVLPLLLTFVLVGAREASAGPITPTYTTFGTLAAATFGGTGIPNSSVAITTINVANGDVITLGLTAHQRYGNPAPLNDGAGTFSVAAGGDLTSVPDGSCPVPANCAPWNWAWYINVVGTGTYSFQIQHEYDPGITDSSLLLTAFSGPGGAGTAQNSWNEEFAFLSGGAFNPNLNGQYSFRLQARSVAGSLLGESAINVNVGTGAPVPEPATLVLLGSGLLGVVAMARRRKLKA